MKVAAIVILALILLCVLLLCLAGMALSATRRARLRGEDKGALDFSDADTVRFSKEALEARRLERDEQDADSL